MITTKFILTCLCLGIVIGICLVACFFGLQLFTTWIFSFGKCSCKDPAMNYRFNSNGVLVCKDCGGKVK